MGYLTQTQQQYYSGKKEFTGDGTTTVFKVSYATAAFPAGTMATTAPVKVYINGTLIQGKLGGSIKNRYHFKYTTPDRWHIDFTAGVDPYGAPASGDTITFEFNNFGSYQFISLNDIIDNFTAAYVGEGKILQNVLKADVNFHAHRSLAELSYDTLKSCKSQEITLPPSLQMILPQDYVNYIKLTWSDANGIEHVLYPASKTSNPFNPEQNADGTFNFDIGPPDGEDDTTELIPEENSDTWGKYKSSSGNQVAIDQSTTTNLAVDADNYFQNTGQRYGLDGQYAQANGSFFIDCLKGMIHFSSNLSGKTIILHYLSDHLGTDDEMLIPKLAEEAIYKWIIYGCLSARADSPEHILARFKREKFAETRKAKIRLSNIKIEEITQVLRGQSKIIKH